MSIDYQNPTTIDAIIDTANLGGSPATVREIVVSGDALGKQAVLDLTVGYTLADEDDSVIPSYYGYLRSDGAWYIKQYAASGANYTLRYVAGTSGYSTNWTNRTSLVYDYYNNVF